MPAGLSPLVDSGGNFLHDADGNQLYVYGASPDPNRTIRIKAEDRVTRVQAE